jgi:type III secretion protein T
MNDDYIHIFLNSTFDKQNPLATLTLFFLFLARILPIISLSPFFGSRVLPHPVKVIFAISLFTIFLPQLLFATTTPLGFNHMAVLLLVKELFIGLILGFFVSVPFSIAQNVGILIDHQRGGASLMVNDPTIQNQSSPLGTLFNFVLIFIFFMIDGPFIFLNAILSSYEVIPPDKFINPRFFNESYAFWDMMVKLFNTVMVISMQLAAPGILAILMTDVFLGIANRLAPQVQITFLGMPLKSLLALTVICLGWKLFSEELIRQCYRWLETVKEILVMMAGH